MKNIILLFSIILSPILFGQIKSNKTDIMIDEMCKDLKSNEKLSDSLKIKSLNEKYILNYLNQFPDSDREAKNDNLFFRFQKRCPYFRDFLQKIDPPAGDSWVKLIEKPQSKITNDEIVEFTNIDNFYYFEYNGQKTSVNTTKKYWQETFTDGTTSKLFITWSDKEHFILEFIESNNTSRKNFSSKGDKYYYTLLSKENNYFWVLVEIRGQPDFFKFKLFPQNQFTVRKF